MKTSGIILGGTLAALLATGAQAETPGKLADLVGAKAAGGEQALIDRGYTHISTETGDDRKWSNWWNSKHEQCITVATVDGRYDSITSTLPADCHKSGKAHSSNGAGVAAGVAAAALIGALALSHKSHDHDDTKHYDDSKSEAGFERGYRDGLYNESYHNYDKSDAYSRGYEAGSAKRQRETSYRDSDRWGGGGYRPSVNVSDLVGARGSSADSEMRSRGFDNVDALTSGYTAYTIWYNRQTKQCMQMGVSDGRVVNLVDIGSSPKCR